MEIHDEKHTILEHIIEQDTDFEQELIMQIERK